MEPTSPPETEITDDRRNHCAWRMSSSLDAAAVPGQQATTEAMFVTFAGNGGRPTARSAGYEINDVIPPVVPTTPASNPAPSKSRSFPGQITAQSSLRPSELTHRMTPADFGESGTSDWLEIGRSTGYSLVPYGQGQSEQFIARQTRSATQQNAL
jgi:hypothetical protein